MWNITPRDVEFAKEELKGRRAAIQARYEGEIEKLNAELDDIEAFERVATAFAQRHKQEEAPASVEPDPIAPLEALPVATDVAIEASETGQSNFPSLDSDGEVEILPETEAPAIAAEPSTAQKGRSRWRMRVSADSP
jgi:hypothetical protein